MLILIIGIAHVTFETLFISYQYLNTFFVNEYAYRSNEVDTKILIILFTNANEINYETIN